MGSMKTLFSRSRLLLLVASLVGTAWCEEPDKPHESLGPLERFDPAPEKLEGLVSVHGSPRLGLPSSAGWGLQRVGSGDKWCVEISGHLALVEWNREAGEMQTKEAIVAHPEWCISPDGKRIFVRRMNDFKQGSECFDLETGKSLWSAGQRLDVADAIFSLDGKQVIILHPAEGGAAVSWHDAATGEMTRRVSIPGKLYRIGGALGTDYLGLTEQAVYVAVPREDEESSSNIPEAWVIKNGSEEAEKLDIDPTPSGELAQVRVGGAHRELLAFYSEDVIELFREENGTLKRIHKIEASGEGDGSYDKCVRFAPDHSRMIISDCSQTLVVTTASVPDPVLKRFKSGARLGDYTADGKFFVTFDDGGGVIRELDTFERADRAKLREFPAHCCPIEDAGFSLSGDNILSNDKHKLLLWSKDGTLLAELSSPNEEARKWIEMQSPIFVDRLKKVYAADGWDFIEWDLNEVADRRKRFPGINPKVVGKVVYRDRVSTRSEPELMNISIDSTGKNLLTATRTTFLFRPLEEPEQKTKLQVPMNDIFMKPRSVYLGDGGSKILVRSGSATFELDPGGKEKEVYLNSSSAGFDPKARKFFRVRSSGRDLVLEALPVGLKTEAEQTMTMPAEWRGHSCNQLLVSSDGRWLIAVHYRSNRLPSLALIDWQEKKIVRDIPLPWQPTSLSLSTDESRLLVGSFNRAIYEFDFKALRNDAP